MNDDQLTDYIGIRVLVFLIVVMIVGTIVDGWKG